MSIRDDFFAAKAKGSLWDVAVSIKRGNPLPLDADSIFESYSALEAYAADVLAYPGQLVAVVNADSTGIYYLDQNLAIQPVGVIPTGDSKTIEVTETGAISLLGAADAANGTLPMIDTETGKLVWRTLEDIGAGDGNDNTTYEFSFANEKITVTPKFNGLAQEVIELDLSNFVTADELAVELGNLVDNDTTYSVLEGEKVLKLNDTVFSTELGLKHENGKISLTGIDGVVIAEFSDADFVQDSFLNDVSYDSETGKISFVWSMGDGSTKTDEIDVSDLIDTYEAGNGLELSGGTFAVKIDSESENFLTVGANGVKLSGVQSAIGTAKQEAIDAAASAAAGIYATKTELGDLETELDSRIDALEAYDHSTYATKTELEGVSTVASNAAQKVETLEDKIDEITSVGGEPNVIEYIQVNGVAQTVTEKTVNIAVPTKFSDLTDNSGFDARITAAKEQADKGVNDASAAAAAAEVNAGEIAKHETRIGNLETAKGNHETRLLNLENADQEHATEYSTLKATVDGHTTAIGGKAAQGDLDAAVLRIAANEGAIKSINENTIPTVNAEIAKKANIADVYTKSDIGTIAEGKTLIDMINEAKTEASYDDSEVRGLITKNADDIAANIIAIATNKSNIETNTAEIAKLKSDIGALTSVMNFVGAKDAIPEDNTGYETGDVIIVGNQEYVFDGENWQAFGDASVNGALISGLDTRVTANENAIKAINNADTGILAQAKSYAADLVNGIPAATADVLGLVKYDNDTIKKNDSSQLYVAKVSTDAIENGEFELILYGGKA